MAFATPKPKGRPAKDKHGTRNTRQENVAGQRVLTHQLIVFYRV